MPDSILLRRDIEAVGFQQSINEPHKFASSKSECASVLMLFNLMKFEGVKTAKFRVAFSQGVRPFAKVIAQMVVAGFDEPGIFCFKIA